MHDVVSIMLYAYVCAHVRVCVCGVKRMHLCVCVLAASS